MASELYELYEEADEDGIAVFWFPMKADQSMAIQTEDGSCAIGIDPWKTDTLAKEKVSMGHELGHCKTGSFYNRYAALDIRKKHENHADKWAVCKLIPVEKLGEAVKQGYTEIWELAEHFNVTEDFMKKAICWYTHGNLSTELYF